MGLLSHITKNQLHLEKKGLLAIAEKMVPSRPYTFADWTADNKIYCAGLFLPVHGIFVLQEAVGLDAESIAHSVSTAAFWNGTLLSQCNWNSYSPEQNGLTSFYQLFSPSFQNTITQLHFIRLQNKTEQMILMIIENTEHKLTHIVFDNDLSPLPFSLAQQETARITDTEMLSRSIEKGLFQSEAHLLLLSLEDAIINSIKNIEIPETEIKAQIIQTISKEITNRLFMLFQSPNCIQQNHGYEFRIALFSREEPDDQVLELHISRMLKPILGLNNEVSVRLLSAGSSKTKQGVLEFLLQE
jgi:hypothetical protein